MVRKFELPEVIKMLNEERMGGTWAKLAKRIGVSRAYLSDLKLGHRLPGPKILNFLGLEKITYYNPPPNYKRRRTSASRPSH